jgi:hypothetical protein
MASGAAWEHVAAIEEANPFPLVRVAVAKRRVGVRLDGGEEFEPIYAYGEDTIRESVERDRAMRLNLFGFGVMEAKINEQHDARLERLLADFRRQGADRSAHKEATGETAARELAEAKSDVTDARLNDLVTFPCRTVADVAAIAAHFVQCEPECTGYVDEDTLLEFVRHLAGRAS